MCVCVCVSVCVCVGVAKHPFYTKLALQTFSRNCSPAPDLVLCKPIFPMVFFSREVIFSPGFRVPASRIAGRAAHSGHSSEGQQPPAMFHIPAYLCWWGLIGEKTLEIVNSDGTNFSFIGENTPEVSKASRVFSPTKLPPV